MSCEGSFDDNSRSSGALVGSAENGHRYPRNVTKFLCDIYDEENEDDPDLEGEGDQLFVNDLNLLRGLFQDVLEEASRTERKDGLGLCDYIDAFLDMRPEMRDEMISTMKNNNISCGLY